MVNNHTFGQHSEDHDEKDSTIRGTGLYQELLRVRKGISDLSYDHHDEHDLPDEPSHPNKRLSRRSSDSSTGSSTLYEKASISSESDHNDKDLASLQSDKLDLEFDEKLCSSRNSRDETGGAAKPQKFRSLYAKLGRASIFPSDPFKVFRHSLTWPQLGELSASKFWNTKRRSECSARSSRSSSWLKSRHSQLPSGLFGVCWREVLPYAGAMVKFQDKVIDLPVLVLKCGGCILDRRSSLVSSLLSASPRSRRSSTSSFEEKSATNVASIRKALICEGKDEQLRTMRATYEDLSQSYGRYVDVSEQNPVEMACLLFEYLFELPTSSFKNLESAFQLASDVLQYSSDDVFGTVLVSILSYDDLMWFVLSVVQTLSGTTCHEVVVDAFAMSISHHIQQLRGVPEDAKDDYFQEAGIRRALNTYLRTHQPGPCMI